MRVWTKIVSTWDAEKQQYVTDEAASEWYEYEGPVTEAKSSGSKSAKREAARQRADEAARQKRIKKGLSEIDRIFSGYNRGAGRLNDLSGFNPNTAYYDNNGKQMNLNWSDKELLDWYKSKQPATTNQYGIGGLTGFNTGSAINNPMGGFNILGRNRQPAGPSIKDLRKKRLQEMLQGGIYSSVENVPGFDDNFFNSRRDAYLNYAKPQLEDQFADQNKNLIFALARGGNLESSLAAERKAKLGLERDQRVIDLGNEAQNVVNSSRQQIENARGDITNQLLASGDNSLALQNAMRQAENLRQMPGFSPVGQLFNDAAGGIGGYFAGRNYGANQQQIKQFDNRVRSPFGGKSMTVG